MPRAFDKLAVISALVLGLLTIGGAWFSQVVGGLVPCDLCLEQRLPYYWGLPLLALLLLLWNRMPLSVWYIGMAIAIAIFAWSTYLAGYHAGVEYGFWPGPTACTGTGLDIDFNDLSDINAASVVPCDKVQFRFLGLTLAGYNVLVSLGMIALLAAAVVNQVRRYRKV